MEVNDAIHIQEYQLPEGVRCEYDEHFTILSITAPSDDAEGEEGEEAEG